ncbi:MAG: nuclear transport factor 2 family protein [Caulobacteraceae bacterium]
MSDEREVQQVLARYVRAADHRDGAAMASLFLPEGTVELFYNEAGTPAPMGELVGAAAIGVAVATMMKPHPPRGWSHHTTHDPIIEVDGDTATLDAQFVVFNIVGAEKPEGGWPKGVSGAQGTIVPIETGYYRPTLKKVDGRWMMAQHRIYLDLPMVF